MNTHAQVEKLAETAQTLDEWIEVRNKALPDSDLKEQAQAKVNKLVHAEAEKLAKTAQTNEDWLEVIDKATVGSKLEKEAKAKIVELVNAND